MVFWEWEVEVRMLSVCKTVHVVYQRLRNLGLCSHHAFDARRR
jgi:hypothetical protein